MWESWDNTNKNIVEHEKARGKKKKKKEHEKADNILFCQVAIF